MTGDGLMRQPLFAVSMLIAMLMATPANGSDCPNAEEVVVRLHQEIRETVAAEGIRMALQRYERMEDLVRETHDLPFIARLTLGRHWGALAESQRKQFTAEFGRLAIATYAGRFHRLGEGSFEVVGCVPLSDEQRLVNTRVVPVGGDSLDFEYLLHRVDSSWRIINIIVDGVSDLALKRAEYSRLMSEEGFDALILELQRQTADLLDGLPVASGGSVD